MAVNFAMDTNIVRSKCHLWSYLIYVNNIRREYCSHVDPHPTKIQSELAKVFKIWKMQRCPTRRVSEGMSVENIKYSMQAVPEWPLEIRKEMGRRQSL